ncbi:MAG: TonB-dependent receptor [Pseudomonadota bacterium]|nr:TonB-dependent receptor [Pseudomonadota bacterium]
MKAAPFALGLLAAAITANLHAETEIIEETLVVGTRASLMSAIDKQEMADGLISVVDSDAMGDFPDTTAAEAIRRLSGISIENDQGEGRYVTIRGLSSDLNSIAVNGATIVAPENDRSVLLDGVPTELLDSITVSKSLTPDQDADSIGGRIDFKTKSPASLEQTLLKIKLDTTYNDQTESANSPRFSVTYGDKLSDDVGHVLGLTYSRKEIETYNNETGYGWDSEGYMDDDYEMRYYDITRERLGVTYEIDYAFADDSRVYFNAFWNEYTDDELRWKDEYGKLDRTAELTNGMTTSRIRHDAETRVREEVRTISAFSVGGETLLNGWFADASLSFSFAEEDDSDNADVTFRNYDKDLGGNIYWENPKKPYVDALDPNLRNPENMKFDEAEFENALSKDEEVAFAINAEQEFDFGTLKFGAKFRSREKDRDINKDFYVFDDKTMADFIPQSLSWPFANQTFGQQADPAAVYALRTLPAGMNLDGQETFVEDFVTDEEIFAVYGMGTFVIDNTRVIAGVRYEDTQVDSQAFDQDGNQTTASSDHDFWAPSITVKHNLSEELVLRAAAWRSLARPGFTATAPALELEISGEDVSGKIGNPDLEPYESNNFDLALELYGEGMTFASVGIFHKDIDNAIYKTIQRSATVNGVTFNDGVETWINADKSTITGLEANVQYGWDSGLFVAANITHAFDSESTFRFNDDKTYTTPFRKLAEDAANLSVGYDKGQWDVRLAMNYRSEYLDWLADEEGDIDTVSVDNSRFVDSHVQWDLTAKYAATENVTIKFEAINIGDRPEYYYWGQKSRLSQYDEYGSSYSLGFTYKM